MSRKLSCEYDGTPIGLGSVVGHDMTFMDRLKGKIGGGRSERSSGNKQGSDQSRELHCGILVL